MVWKSAFKLTLLVVALLGLTACSGGDGDGQVSASADTATTPPTTPGTPVASAPTETCIPGNNTFTVEAGKSITVSLSAIYADDRGNCYVQNVGAPQHGTITFANRSVTYTPNSGYTGSDTFMVTYTDGHTSTVTVNVVAAADPAPIAGGAFAALADMEISDQAWLGPILPINAGWVTDALNRTIVYSATGLPPGLSIDSSTGVISGTYDASPTTAFSVTVKAQATGSTNSATKQFTLTIRNDG